MSAKVLLRTISVIATLLLAPCFTPATLARGGGGGGGHGGGGGGFGGGHGGSFGGGHGGGGSFGGRGFSGYSGARSFAAPSYGGGQFGRSNGGYTANRAFAGNGWNGNGWNHHGNWNGGHDWDNYFNRGFYGGYGLGWGDWGGYWPGNSGWDWDWGYPYYYSVYGDYPSDAYYDTYPNAQSDYSTGGGAVNTVPQPVPTISTDQNQQGASEAEQYYGEARAAFLQGDYKNALKLGAHAEIEGAVEPQGSQLLSLGLFAAGNYPAAASEAHAAMATGPITEWKDLYAYYNDVDKYTSQLRALEKATTDNPKAAADHFLLGYQYLMIGAQTRAQEEFTIAVQLTPKDKLAAHYLAELKSNAPLTPPRTAATPQGQAR